MAKRDRFIRVPDAVEVDRESLTDTFGRFTLGPLVRGWGWTMGTILRRSMLSSVEGAAPTQLLIDGIIHEFSTIEGVLEDVPLIVLNVKKLRFRLAGEGPEYARLHATEPAEHSGANLELSANLVLINPDAPLLTVTGKDRKVHLEIKVERGRGYENQEIIKKRSPVESQGTIFLDAFYSPVRQVKIDVTNVRFGERTDYEQVTFDVTTDGSVTPEEALAQSAELLKDHVQALTSLSELDANGADSQAVEEPEWVQMPIDGLEIPQTVKKALADRSILTVGKLVVHTEAEVRKWNEIKPRSLATLLSRLKALGAEFNAEVAADDAADVEAKDKV